jgi:hypothetical protein
MTEGDETPRRSGLPDPAAVPAPRPWGPAPRRWVPGSSWAAATTTGAPAARRSALTPLPEDDDEIVSTPRRSALSPRDDEEPDDAVAPRRSALSPLPLEDQPATAARRSAFTPSERDDYPAPRRSAWVDEGDDDDDEDDEDDEETLRSPLPRRSSEYATAALAIQPALPEIGPTPVSPAAVFSPEAPSPVTDAISQPSPSVQQTLPDPVLSGPVAEFAGTELPPVTVPEATMAAAAVAAEFLAMPDLAELPAAVAEKQELLAEEGDMVSEGAPAVEESSTVGDDTATWLYGSAFSDADHSLYKRPAPGEPETEVDLTPIVIDDPEYDVRKGTSPRAKASPSNASRSRRAKPTRGKTARRVHVAWRDHRRLLTISSIVLALLLVVSVGGYLFSRYNPTLAAINEGKLTLPPTAGDYRRDPSQGISPSADPMGKTQTVSATYSRGGDQQFVAIAYRPQTDPKAALEEIQARSVTSVEGGACGRTTDQNRLACAVVSGATAVLLMTLVEQSPDELIAAAQSVASGIGKT